MRRNTKCGREVMRLATLQAIWQPCAAILQRACETQLFHGLVRVFTPPVNYVNFETAISEVVFRGASRKTEHWNLE